ncbi:MAG TPA: AI-2E family transporter [Pseudoxanthomonas sp.]|nr:AI-2E family transporter [Pseudoxanthomonas sp.]
MSAHAPRPRASLALLVLTSLAVGYTLWAAQDLLLPILLGMFFALVGNPIIRALRRLRMPRFVAALFVLLGGMSAAAALGNQLVVPASDWFRDVPQQIVQLAPKLREMARPMQEANEVAENIARAAGGEDDRRVEIVRTQVDDPYKVLTRMPRLLASLLAVVLLTFFFMVYGESLQRHAIALLQRPRQKKFTMGLLHSIEREVSRYVLTISVINTVMGLLFAVLLYALDVPLPEALLWGTLVAVLNFAPYVGPLIGIVLMLLVGFVTYSDPWLSLLPSALYLVLHTVESQLVTPIVLGKRMSLSPLVLILALMVFGWLWGIIGLLLAVPLLVCVKLVLARVDGLEGWARLLE